MKKAKMLSLTAGLVLAITFTLSCSSDDGDEGGGGGSSSSGGGGGSSSSSQCSNAGSGTFTDDRDGQTYRYVTICSTWMAENLNYNASGSRCFNDLEDNCDTYGRLYDWTTANNACPSGWHLASRAEWRALQNLVGGKEIAGTKLKATSGWGRYGGTDDYGFSALPGGHYNSQYGYLDIGDRGDWWGAYGSSASFTYGYSITNGYGLNESTLSAIGLYYSVRCIKD